MAATPYAKVLVSVDGSPNVSGGLDVPSAAEITLSPESIVGWGAAIWEFYDYPEGWEAPAGWSLRDDGAVFYAGYTPPAFTLPANTTLWGVWMLRLRLIRERGGDIVDESTSLSMLSPKGLRDIGAREQWHFTTALTRIKKWLRSYQRNLRTIESQLGGAGGAVTELAGDEDGVATLSAETVRATADPYTKIESSVGHFTTDNEFVTTAGFLNAPEPSVQRVDVVVTATALFSGELVLATFAIHARVKRGYGGLSIIDGTDPNPGIDSELAGVSAELGTNFGELALRVKGLADTRITWGWEIRIQRQLLEPEAP